MSIGEQDKELIERIKAMERAEREPIIQPEKSDTEKAIGSATKAVCGTIVVISLLAYAVSPIAFWKPQNRVEEWCLDNGYTIFNKGSTLCEAYYVGAHPRY